MDKPLTFPVQVTALPASADDMLLDSVFIANVGNDDGTDGVEPGDDAQTAKRKVAAYAKQVAAWRARVPEIRKRAAGHPGDALAEMTLAEAEIRLGDRAEGEAILERRLKANPKEVDALVLAGVSRVLAAAKTPDRRQALYTEAQSYLARANALDPNRYQLLYAYAKSQSARPNYPDENTLNVLRLAHQLAPQVDEVTLTLAEALGGKADAPERKRLLTLLASAPHGGSIARRASTLLKASETTG